MVFFKYLLFVGNGHRHYYEIGVRHVNVQVEIDDFMKAKVVTDLLI
jgi:hypothetical protein